MLYSLAIIFFSCEESPEFPTDGNSNIDPPVTTFVTEPGTIFTDSTVTIHWEGNESARIFDYRLEYVSTSAPDNWIEEDSWIVPPDSWAEQHSWPESDTTSATSVEFYNLDEGVYRFYINGRYDIDNIGDLSN